MHFFYAPDISEKNAYLLQENEAHHVINVLRSKVGDIIFLTDGKGNSYKAELTEINKKICGVNIISRTKHKPKSYKIYLAIAPPKTGDRLDFLLEKITELGVDSIIPITTQNSERRKLNRDKETFTIIAAIKQAGNPFLPLLLEMTDFKKFISDYKEFKGQKFICHCRENDKTSLANLYKVNSDVLICIGPEGDFTKDEIALATTHNFVAAELGERILRTETAGISACVIINTINQIVS